MYITEHPREADAGWISTAAAVKLVALARNDGPLTHAQEFLVRHAAADRILTRCSTMTCVDTLRGQQKWEEVLVSYEFWTRFSQPNGCRLQDWLAGDFSILQFGRLGARTETSALGVQFSKSDLSACLPSAPESPGNETAAYQNENGVNKIGDQAIKRKNYGGRNLTHNHPFAAASAALELAKLPKEKRSGLNAASVGLTMKPYYLEEKGEAPGPDNLDTYGEAVLAALEAHWEKG